jgi:hypothetical protein
MQSIYWVITRNCTQRCAHCYIGSGPGEESLSVADVERIVDNLPSEVNQVILGGGELLVDKPLLYTTLDALHVKFGNGTPLMIQSNGDLLNRETVEELLERHVRRIDISSIDDFHENRHTREELEHMLDSCGVTYLEFPSFVDEDGNMPSAAYSFWGATPELWLGGMWPRGRALENGLWTKNPSHNFCNRWSGALGFLDNGSPQQEINIRLKEAYPCCPATKIPLGNVREESLLDILDQHRDDPVFQALNRGEPEAMGVELGISVEFANKRVEELGSCCLWCDEFFAKHYRNARSKSRASITFLPKSPTPVSGD